MTYYETTFCVDEAQPVDVRKGHTRRVEVISDIRVYNFILNHRVNMSA